ncbi:hypothetical protein R3P38DRAFT_3197407 [Favolaschia claudopus]|uniref:Integrase core domain-containing protein n=1 Tax=Favolaschia claudopus TaxID=2862362 RepID=A0AAW0B515_9AGAR
MLHNLAPSHSISAAVWEYAEGWKMDVEPEYMDSESNTASTEPSSESEGSWVNPDGDEVDMPPATQMSAKAWGKQPPSIWSLVLTVLGVPRAFTQACANVIGPLACELKLAALAAQGIVRATAAMLSLLTLLKRFIRENEGDRKTRATVPRSIHLWHCDGHHKLILWGFVIHGFVDGYCRTITGMRASNRASTVLDVFKEAIAPYRVRGDRGGENVKVSVWMILHRGPNRASLMWRSSTHNTRIKRLWVTQFARQWRAFFIRLGDLHRLDRKNAAHIWLLHLLFLDSLNADCREFQELWNRHPISGRQGNDQSPKGMIDSGEYVDPMQGIHPDTIDRYYGVDGPEVVRQPGQTGAGHEEDEDEDENAWVDEPERLVDAVTSQHSPSSSENRET